MDKKRKLKRRFVGTNFLGLILAGAAPAATLFVAADTPGCGGQTPCFTSLQAAADAANDGDTLRVAKGVYRGTATRTSAITGYDYTQVLFVEGKNLEIKGGYSSSNWNVADPAINPTLIDAQGYGRAVTLLGESSDPKTVVLHGLQLINGDYTGLGNAEGVANQACAATGSDCGGGLFAQQLSVVLDSVLVKDNIASRSGSYSSGAGAFLWAVQDVTVRNSFFINNSNPRGYGGGLVMDSPTGTVLIEDTEFDLNQAFTGGGLYYFNGSGKLTLKRSRFVDNSASDEGGGFWMASMGHTLLSRLELHGNQATTGSAGYFRKPGSTDIELKVDNLMAVANKGGDNNQGVLEFSAWGGSMTLEARHLTLAGNQAPVAIVLSSRASGSKSSFESSFINTLVDDADYAFGGNQMETGPLVIEMQHLFLADTNIDSTLVIDGAPVFRESNVKQGKADLDDLYRLGVASDAIDTGANAGLQTDLDGDARVGKPDIGADEYNSSATAQYRFSRFGYQGGEGDQVRVQVQRIGTDLGQTSVDYATQAGTASDADFTAVSGTLVFAQGETEKSFQVTLTDDQLYDPGESVNLLLSNPGAGSRLGWPAQAQISIKDNDPSSFGRIEFAKAEWRVREQDLKLQIQVQRRDGASGAVSVDYATNDVYPHDATAGEDYQATSGTLNFADGQTSAVIEVQILADGAVEDDESFGLVLTRPTGGAVLGGQKEASVVIEDDDDTGLQLGFAQTHGTRVQEGRSLNLLVRLNTAANRSLSVDYVSQDAMAVAPDDYKAVSGTLQFAPGETEKAILIEAVADGKPEPQENFYIQLSNPSDGLALQPERIMLNIIDAACAENTTELRVAGPKAYTGSYFCAAQKIVAGDLEQNNGKVRVPAPADVTYQAPRIELKPGFQVEQGGRFNAGKLVQP